jgi:hypothetical protein
MACGTISESVPAFDRRSAPWPKSEPGSHCLLKNNIRFEPAWQEIVDFS